MKILSVFGTRPEAIKMASIVHGLKKFPNIESLVCVTAQHRSMLDGALRFFDVKPDIDLNIMRPGQGLADITSAIINGIDRVLADWAPDWVLVHGDTTTAFAASLAAFYRGISVGHIEAGLRSGRLDAPFPEEMNRIFVDLVARHHYVPTQLAARRLQQEGRPEDSIFVTGNTVVDALHMAAERTRSDLTLEREVESLLPGLDPRKRLILVTGHRRESFGGGFDNICGALAQIARRDDVEIVYPVHLNPNVRKPVSEILGRTENVRLIDPVDYPIFVYLMQRCFLILTDSGGIQEEAPSLGKPVLVMRDVTERAEAVQCGAVKLVGTDSANIVLEVTRLLDETVEWAKMATAGNPYGDGKAGERICAILASLA